ncbi:MAG: carbohydrate ABC transporter permease [Oscillospiraceae bacterium]|jgi:putative aldouronate transport system permease protein|nr:carbohydrate ABC transporter permease [Oscillospiraceae bacterium]
MTVEPTASARRGIRKSAGERAFEICNGAILSLLALLCLAPFVHILAVSLSSSQAATAGRVGFWPVDLSLNSYQYATQNPVFISAFGVTVRRVLLGVSVDTLLVTLAAYPLSKTNREMPGRTILAWIFVTTMFVGGGMIPSYLVVNATGLRNTLWALVIPGAVKPFNMTILLNFFRQTPKDLEESALIDGAPQPKILWYIYLPLALPALATLTIFDTVGHWNEWFSGLIYMDKQVNQPLQTYLRGVIIQPDFTLLNQQQIELMSKISSKTYQAAQIMIATTPVLAIYPFLQKYFIKGLTLGSLKG